MAVDIDQADKTLLRLQWNAHDASQAQRYDTVRGGGRVGVEGIGQDNGFAARAHLFENAEAGAYTFRGKSCAVEIAGYPEFQLAGRAQHHQETPLRAREFDDGVDDVLKRLIQSQR